MRLLLIEDDPDLSRELSGELGRRGFAVDCCREGVDGAFMGETEPYDIIVLDLGLPDIPGLTILEQWRSKGVKTPVLILTARGAWHEKVEGFRKGADDYLSKPFHIEELVVRLEALVKRSAGVVVSSLEIGRLRLDEGRQSAQWREGNDWRDIKGPDGQRLLILQNTIQLGGLPITIRIAEDILPLELSTGAFQRYLLLFAIAAVLALMILQGWLISHSLKPLQRVRRQINSLKSGELGQIDAPAPDEIMPLVDEVNHLLHLMQQRLQRSRHALGDLAHSLKTPLAVARQITERQRDSDDNKQLDEQLERIEQRIERELVRARTAGRMPGGQWGDPERDLHDIARMLGQAFPHIDLKLQFDAQLKIPADREDMLEIFGNLLENACKWARSQVRCRVSHEQHQTYVCIEDDGPGIEEDKYEQLLFRGVRADESRPGHGLGLSIVSEMVAAYEGSIELSRSADLHGLKVRIVLP